MSTLGKERLERALVRLSRISPRPAGRGRRVAEPGPGATVVRVFAPDSGEVSPAGEVDGPSLPVELLALVDRLDNIADRLADLEHPGRPLPATRAIFSEWVRLRKLEEIPFLDFLTLRRAGRL